MEEKELLNSLEGCIEEAWEGVKKDYSYALWWEEAEIVASFYHHLRQNDKFKKLEELEDIQVIPEYTPKPKSDFLKSNERKNLAPALKPDIESDPTGTCHIDLCIVKFNENPRKVDGENLWEIKHRPLVAMEFKYWIGKKDIPQLVDINGYIDNYDGFDERYLCFIEDKKNVDYIKRKLREQLGEQKEKEQKKLKEWKIAYLLDYGNEKTRCSVVSLEEFLTSSF